MSKSDELALVAIRHAEAEGQADFAGTMATLNNDPVYELYPVGLRMRGRDKAVRYYEHFFAEVQPRLESTAASLRSTWQGESGLCQEYDLIYRYDDGRRKEFRILGILTYGVEFLSGERIYADEELLRLMFGPLWSDLEVIAGIP